LNKTKTVVLIWFKNLQREKTNRKIQIFNFTLSYFKIHISNWNCVKCSNLQCEKWVQSFAKNVVFHARIIVENQHSRVGAITTIYTMTTGFLLARIALQKILHTDCFWETADTTLDSSWENLHKLMYELASKITNASNAPKHIHIFDL
jgi:hypothetical protein